MFLYNILSIRIILATNNRKPIFKLDEIVKHLLLGTVKSQNRMVSGLVSSMAQCRQ